MKNQITGEVFKKESKDVVAKEVKEKNQPVAEVKEEPKKDVEAQVEQVKNEEPVIPESTKSLETIRGILKQAKDLKVVETEAKTGFSFFQGKKRLCKVLKTKRGVVLEINVRLPKKFSEIPGMENISAALAHKKHLGTMKHLFRAPDAKQIKEIMLAAIEVFKAELEAEKKAIEKEEAQAQ